MSTRWKRHTPQEENVESWLMSYADMITLLLAFFIIFVSTSEPKQDKLAAATRGMREKFGSLSFESPLDGAFRQVAGTVAADGSDRFIAVEKTSRGMRVEMSATELFEPGTAQLKPDHADKLKEIAQAMQKTGTLAQYNIAVEGHTSDAPALSEGSTAWDLSSARALTVLRALTENGVKAGRMNASGFGGTQPKVPNLDAAGAAIPTNRTLNERVVVVLESEK